jgi:hypothetical protein
MPASSTLPPSEQWLLAGRLLGLIQSSGFTSLRAAAAQIEIEYTVLWQTVHGRPPTARTLRRILQGLNATETSLLSAPDLPIDTRLAPCGRKLKKSKVPTD